MSSEGTRFERTSPSALTFAKLLGDGPMARVALEASLGELGAPAFIVSATGTVLHANAEAAKRVAASADQMRGELVRAVKSLGDETEAGPALVTPLRCEDASYFLVIFREPPSPAGKCRLGRFALGAHAATDRGARPSQRGILEQDDRGRLGCAERTVEAHLTAIFEKIGLPGAVSELLAAMVRRKS